MTRLTHNIVSLLFATLIVAGCATSPRRNDPATGEVLPVKYAVGFTLTQGQGYTQVEVIDPWDTTRLMATYLLVPHDEPLPTKLPQGTVVRTPITNTLVFSSVHCSLLEELGCSEAIGGVCDTRYIHSPLLQQRLQEGSLVDAGSSMAPGVERIMDMQPGAILLSPFAGSGYERLEKIGIPIIQCTDYLETSPLGRAEWMRLYGLLYGCSDVADSLFAAVEASYNATRNRVGYQSRRPTAITERLTGAVWYMPGGRSYIAAILADAGCDYPWSDNDDVGSLPLSIENVLERGSDAQYWLVKYNTPAVMTYDALAAHYPLYTHFAAFKERRIYGCNTDSCLYYEETPFHPDRLLQDLAAIFHPHLFEDYTPHYYHPLAQ